MARSVFACLAASSASERAFSKAGAIYSKRRGGNMKPSTLEALCFLHSAAKELEVAKTDRAHFDGQSTSLIFPTWNRTRSVLLDTFHVQF